MKLPKNETKCRQAYPLLTEQTKVLLNLVPEFSKILRYTSRQGKHLIILLQRIDVLASFLVPFPSFTLTFFGTKSSDFATSASLQFFYVVSTWLVAPRFHFVFQTFETSMRFSHWWLRILHLLNVQGFDVLDSCGKISRHSSSHFCNQS